MYREGSINCLFLDAILSRLRDSASSVRSSALLVLIQNPFPEQLQLNKKTLETMEELLKLEEKVIQQGLTVFVSKWFSTAQQNVIQALTEIDPKSHERVAKLLMSVVDRASWDKELLTLSDILTEPLDRDERVFLLLEGTKTLQTDNSERNAQVFQEKIGDLSKLKRTLPAANWWIQCKCLEFISGFKPIPEELSSYVKLFCVEGLAQLSCPPWNQLLKTMQTVLSEYTIVAEEALRQRLTTFPILDCLDFASAMLLVDHKKVTPEMGGLLQYAWSLKCQTESTIRFELLYSLSASSCGQLPQLMQCMKREQLERKETLCQGLFDLLCTDALEGQDKTHTVKQLTMMLCDYSDVLLPIGDTLRIGMMKLLWKGDVLSIKTSALIIHHFLKLLLKHTASKTHEGLVISFLRVLCRDVKNGAFFVIVAFLKIFQEMMKKALLVESIGKRAEELVGIVLDVTSFQKEPHTINLESPPWWVLDRSPLTLLTLLTSFCFAETSTANKKVLSRCMDKTLDFIDLTKPEAYQQQSLSIVFHMLQNCAEVISARVSEFLKQLSMMDLVQLDDNVMARIQLTIDKMRSHDGMSTTPTPVKRPLSSEQTQTPIVLLIEDGFENTLRLSQLCQSIGIRVLTAQESFVPEVTHVLSPICTPFRTIDCFATVIALLTGRWVVSMEWLEICVEKQLVKPDSSLGCAKFSDALPLKGLRVFVAESFASQFDQDLHVVLHLLERAGGVNFVERPSEADIILSGEDVSTPKQLPENCEKIGEHGEVLSWSTFALRLFKMAQKETEKKEAYIPSSKRTRTTLQ